MSETSVDVLDEADREREIWQLAIYDVMSPIVPYLEDDSVSEIMINGADDIYIERKGVIERTEARFNSEYELEAGIRRIAQYSGRFLGDNLEIDARLPDGGRVQIIRSPAARNGVSVAIRKFFKVKLTIEKLIESNSLTQEMADYLSHQVRSHRNMIIAGGTGTGKTTMLNVLANFADPAERILTIEDTAELQLSNPHVVTLESQKARKSGKGGITIRELFKASLRMRPDRIIVGECRGGEAIELLQAMTSGHDGTLATLHASGIPETLNRLETMALMGDVDIPMTALKRQIASAVHVVVQIVRDHDGPHRGRRRIATVAEIDAGLNAAGDYTYRKVFEH